MGRRGRLFPARRRRSCGANPALFLCVRDDHPFAELRLRSARAFHRQGCVPRIGRDARNDRHAILRDRHAWPGVCHHGVGQPSRDPLSSDWLRLRGCAYQLRLVHLPGELLDDGWALPAVWALDGLQSNGSGDPRHAQRGETSALQVRSVRGAEEACQSSPDGQVHRHGRRESRHGCPQPWRERPKLGCS